MVTIGPALPIELGAIYIDVNILETVATRKQLMILGRSGAGKTMFVKRMGALCNRGEFLQELVPIFVSLQSIRLSWEVTGGEGLQVELYPSPGTVPLEASLTYPLALRETDETITLQVSDAEGNQIQRSVVISTTFANTGKRQ